MKYNYVRLSTVMQYVNIPTNKFVNVTAGALSSVAVLENEHYALCLQKRPLPGESPSQSDNCCMGHRIGAEWQKLAFHVFISYCHVIYIVHCVCVFILLSSSEGQIMFQANSEQEPCDLYQELVTGMPSQSQGIIEQHRQKVFCVCVHISFDSTCFLPPICIIKYSGVPLHALQPKQQIT